ncbi:MAG: hypothetical protein GY938_24400 [Ketobacter sp.]|nr:hypothetical protein [Ketobacter sp.]
MGKVENITGGEVGKEQETPPASFNFDEANPFVVLIEELNAKIDVISEDAAKKKAPLTEKRNELYKQAASNDVTRKVLKHYIADRDAKRKRAAALAKLSEEHQGQVQQLALNFEAEEAEAEAA